MLIMVAEDDRRTAELIEALLTPSGHDVVIVSDGLSAVDVATHRQPDLIFMDVLLPRCSGVAAAQEIREHTDAAVAGVPIVAMSASLTLLAIGRPGLFNSMLPKPFDITELLELVDEMAS